MHPTKEIIAGWPKHNWVNPETRGPALTVVNIIFIILVFVVVGLRYYTRIKITRNFGQDDVVIGLSLVGHAPSSTIKFLVDLPRSLPLR